LLSALAKNSSFCKCRGQACFDVQDSGIESAGSDGKPTDESLDFATREEAGTRPGDFLPNACSRQVSSAIAGDTQLAGIKLTTLTRAMN
jgi:hypothetical protein